MAIVISKNKQLNQIERDVILSDAMLGYLYFICNVKYNGKDWLYQKHLFNSASQRLAVFLSGKRQLILNN